MPEMICKKIERNWAEEKEEISMQSKSAQARDLRIERPL